VQPDNLASDDTAAGWIDDYDHDGSADGELNADPGEVAVWLNDETIADGGYHNPADEDPVGMAVGLPDVGSASVGDSASVHGDWDTASSTYPDEAVRPSTEEIAAARATLAAAGVDMHESDPSVAPVSGMGTDDLKELDENMKSSAEDAALLSDIASQQHQINMGIIGNMR